MPLIPQYQNYTPIHTRYQNNIANLIKRPSVDAEAKAEIKDESTIKKDIETEETPSVVSATKSISINLSNDNIVYKSKASQEKYSSNNISAALMWGREQSVTPSPEVSMWLNIHHNFYRIKIQTKRRKVSRYNEIILS